MTLLVTISRETFFIVSKQLTKTLSIVLQFFAQQREKKKKKRKSSVAKIKSESKKNIVVEINTACELFALKKKIIKILKKYTKNDSAFVGAHITNNTTFCTFTSKSLAALYFS